jgi:hypothetical protein
MIIIGIVSSIFGIGFLCWLLFTLAVAGLTASLAAFDSGSGAIAALVVGVLAGGATLTIGQIAFAAFRPPPIRAAIALLYMAPVTIAGYHATLGFAHIGVPSESWREALAMVGAVFVGATAFIRIALFAPRRSALWRVRRPRHLRPCPETVSRRVVVIEFAKIGAASGRLLT